MLYYVQMKWTGSGYVYSICRKDTPASDAVCVYTTNNGFIGDFFILQDRIYFATKYSLQGTTQGRYLTGGVPPIRFSM